MINTLKIFDQLQTALDPTAAKTIADIFGTIYEDLQNTVTKTEFNELKEVVKELAEVQKRTEARIEELAEAQKRNRRGAEAACQSS